MNILVTKSKGKRLAEITKINGVYYVDMPERVAPLEVTNSFANAWFNVTVSAMRMWKTQLRIKYTDSKRQTNITVTPASTSDARESQMNVARTTLSRWMQ